MKKRILITIFIFLSVSSVFGYSYVRNSDDSLTVFFVGTKKGERYRVYFQNKLVIEFRSSSSYKHSVTVPRLGIWEKGGQVIELVIFRRGRFGFSYRQVTSSYKYQGGKRYLILTREDYMKNFFPFAERWSDEQPQKPKPLH